jgi:hypothetical protein
MGSSKKQVSRTHICPFPANLAPVFRAKILDCQLPPLCARIPPLKYSPVLMRSPYQKAVLRNLVVEESSMATTTTAVPAPEAQVPINHFGRIIGVFFSPKETFQSIAQRPSWILPVVLMTVLGCIVGFALNKRVDWREIASKRIEESSRAAQLSAEQKEQQIAMSAKISPAFAYGFGLLGPILLAVIVSGVMLGAYNLLGDASANFKVSMGIVSHAYVVTIVNSLLFLLVLFLKPPGTVNIENPVATNLGAFLPDGTSKTIMALGTAIDLFSFWTIFLIGLGFAAYNPKKLKLGSSISIALAVWAVYQACRLGLTFVFS